MWCHACSMFTLNALTMHAPIYPGNASTLGHYHPWPARPLVPGKDFLQPPPTVLYSEANGFHHQHIPTHAFFPVGTQLWENSSSKHAYIQLWFIEWNHSNRGCLLKKSYLNKCKHWKRFANSSMQLYITIVNKWEVPYVVLIPLAHPSTKTVQAGPSSEKLYTYWHTSLYPSIYPHTKFSLCSKGENSVPHTKFLL